MCRIVSENRLFPNEIVLVITEVNTDLKLIKIVLFSFIHLYARCFNTSINNDWRSKDKMYHSLLF